MSTNQKQSNKIDYVDLVLRKLETASDEYISNIGEEKILNFLKALNKNKNVQIKLKWRSRDVDFCPYIDKKDKNQICQCIGYENNIIKKYKRNLSRIKAFKYAKTIHERLKSIDGVFLGIDSDFRYQIVTNVWVFGSMAKGSQNPNDLDILYNCVLLSPRLKLFRSWRNDRWINIKNQIDNQFSKCIRDGLNQISLHGMGDNCLVKDHKIEIYPKFKLKL